MHWKNRIRELRLASPLITVYRLVRAPWIRLKRYAEYLYYRKCGLHMKLDNLPGKNHLNFLSHDPQAWINTLTQQCSQECQQVEDQAKRIIQHQVMLFGSWHDIGTPIQWHCDFQTMHHWDNQQFFRNISIQPDQGYDIKVPWELSRFHHLLSLGQAYWLSNDARYAQCIIEHIESWIAANQTGFGIHWINPMEVAIRAINWLVAWEFLDKKPHDGLNIDQHTKQRWQQHLLEHANYIYKHLEYSPQLTSNHYICDLIGLFTIAVAFPDFHQAKQWKSFAITQLSKELKRQVYPDGFHGEASTTYHCLVLESYLLVMQIAQSHDIALPDEIKNYVTKMLSVLKAITRTDGSIPQIGDNDSGRILPFIHKDKVERSYLLNWGASLLQHDEFYFHDSTDYDACWLSGNIKNNEQLGHAQHSQAFSDGGIYSLRNPHDHLLLRCGSNGIFHYGHHAHNDALSFDLAIDDELFIVDPGTGAYTADLTQRNRFRSTAFHSTIQVDAQEINPLAQEAFRLYDDAQATLTQWESNAVRDIAVAEHSGYKQLQSDIRVQRKIIHHKSQRCFYFEDTISGLGTHNLSQIFHIAPDIIIKESSNRLTLQGQQAYLLIIPLNTSPNLLSLEDAAYSKGYAQVISSKRAVYHYNGRLPYTFKAALISCSELPSEQSLQELIKNVEESHA